MLLRSLGYPTRLVSGFYADEDDLDRRSGFAALDADDLHTWIEVRLADGMWITVDPVPGQPMLNLPRPAGEWLVMTLRATARTAADHLVLLSLAAAIVVMLVLLRHELRDRLATLRCRWLGRFWPELVPGGLVHEIDRALYRGAPGDVALRSEIAREALRRFTRKSLRQHKPDSSS